MKTLYLIGGTMGVGKTTVSQQLKKDLANSVFLDGDWCWDADPFQVTDETKEMVMDNICYLLNNFLAALMKTLFSAGRCKSRVLLMKSSVSWTRKNAE